MKKNRFKHKIYSNFIQNFKFTLILAVMIISANCFGQIPTPIISGYNNDCDNSATYTVSNPNSLYTYTWTLSAGGYISNMNGSPQITVIFDHTITNCNYASLSVTANYQGSTSATANFEIYPCCYNAGANYVLKNYSTSTNLSFNPNDVIVINGDFIINNDVSFDHAFVYVSPNSKIILNKPNITLSIINGSIISDNTINCCSNMWDGIYTNDLTQHINIQASAIKNAQHAVNIYQGSTFLIEDNEFVENYKNIYIYQGSGGGTPPYNGIIRGNFFVGSNSLQHYPYQGVQTYSGVDVFRTDSLIIGDPSSASYLNQFNDMFCGIKTEQSYVEIYNNLFRNINLNTSPAGNDPTFQYNSTAIFSIGDPILSSGNLWHGLKIGGSGLYRNNFNNCYNGIYAYNQLLQTESNNLNTTNLGIVGKDLFDDSYVSNNTIAGPISATDHTRTGISISNIQPRDCNIKLNGNSINAINRGIMITSANSNASRNLLVQIYSNTIFLDGNNPPVNKPNSAIKANGCYGINIYDNSLSIANWAIPDFENLFYGIDISQVNNGLITNNPFINRYGAGINVYGDCNFTQFFCNKIYDGYYGFLFNYQSTITSQGYAYPSPNIPTDNEWFGNWSLGNTTRRLWAASGHLLNGNTRWFVRDPTPYTYQLLNGISPNPTIGYIIQSTTTNTQTPCAGLPVPLTTIGISANEREELYGKIVRDSNTYTQLEEQFKEYDKKALYKAIKENQAMMYLGDSSDILYQDFYVAEAAGNIEKIAEIEALIKDKQDSLAMIKNATLLDQKLIDYFRKQVNEIYLNTFAEGNYSLTQEQIEILMPIAVNYTPWEGGDAVYIARQMLNLDDEVIEADFAKSPKTQPTNAKTMNAKLYPNPASDEVMIEFNNALNANAVLEIYGYTGNLLQSNQLKYGYQFISVSVKDLKAGLYFYKITSVNEVVCKNKLLIIK
jgi:hypothetical protein